MPMEVRSIETIVRTLNHAKVKYLIVGGVAVNVHGYERLTADIDLVVGLKRDNILRALHALKSAGWQLIIPVKPDDFANARLRESWRKEKNLVALKLWSDAHQRTPIDVFVYEPFDFAKEFAAAEWRPIRGKISAPVVSYSTLIAMKKEAGRDKDLLDIKQLKKLDPYR